MKKENNLEKNVRISWESRDSCNREV